MEQNSKMPKAAFLLGIIALVLSLTPFISGWFLILVYVVWLLAILSLIFGIIGIVKKQQIAKCIIGIVLSVIAVFMPSIFKEQFAEKAAESATTAIGWISEQ